MNISVWISSHMTFSLLFAGRTNSLPKMISSITTPIDQVSQWMSDLEESVVKKYYEFEYGAIPLSWHGSSLLCSHKLWISVKTNCWRSSDSVMLEGVIDRRQTPFWLISARPLRSSKTIAPPWISTSGRLPIMDLRLTSFIQSVILTSMPFLWIEWNWGRC